MSLVESFYLGKEPLRYSGEYIDSIIVSSFPELGKLAAFRFLEFVTKNPNGVVSLPTGKTPEYFIRWVIRILRGWSDDSEIVKLRTLVGLVQNEPPGMSELRFVQMDEFYPIDSSHANSYNFYIRKFYIEGFGMDVKNCLLMDGDVDVHAYEEQIKRWGGIGFFLGGIGPDGHVAFNIRGSRSDSVTRRLDLNYESLASSGAEAMGGMTNARNMQVFTIGLSTIVANRNCVAIIFAAGEAKANIVCEAITGASNVCVHSSHALRVLPNSRFYLTHGSAKCLPGRLSAPVVTGEHLRNALELGLKYVERSGQKIVHTEPHHDDILLGYLPLILKQMSSNNKHVFVCGTSGFNSVSNGFLQQRISLCKTFEKKIYMDEKNASEIFARGFANNDQSLMNESFVDRFWSDLKRSGFTSCAELASAELDRKLEDLHVYLKSLYPGQRENVLPAISLLKSYCREFEAECLWVCLGFSTSQIHHLRLGFYTGDIFAPKLTFQRDIQPILDVLVHERPEVVTVSLDPESSGPETHYKMLQAVTAALQVYSRCVQNEPRVIGYRNVWYTFSVAETNMVVPVSNAEMTRMTNLFLKCFQSQSAAEFPSYELDGPFCEISKKNWVHQLNVFRECAPIALPSDTCGLLFLKEMSITELSEYSQSLKNQLE